MADDSTGRDLSEPQGPQPRSEGGPSGTGGGSSPARRVPPRTPASRPSGAKPADEEPGALASFFAPVMVAPTSSR